MKSARIEQHWWPVIIVILAAPFLFLGWIINEPGEDKTTILIYDVVIVIGGLLPVIATFMAALRYWPGRTALGWLLISAGLLMSTLGDVAWSVQELAISPEVPFPSVADIGYLALYPLVFLGLLLMPEAPTSPARRIKLSLDITVGIIAVAVLCWRYAIADFIAETDASTSAYVVGLAYPIADVAIILAVMLLIARGVRTLSAAALALLAVGFAVIAFMDVAYVYLEAHGQYGAVNYIDAGWFAGDSLIAVAAIIAAGRQLNLDKSTPRSDITLNPVKTAVPYTPLAICGIVLVAAGPQAEVSQWAPMTIGFLAATTVLIIRQIITILENNMLNQELKETAAKLAASLRIQRIQALNRSGYPMPKPPSDDPAVNGWDNTRAGQAELAHRDGDRQS